LGSGSGNVLPLLRREGYRTMFTAFKTASATASRGITLGFAYGILSLTSGNIDNQFRKLVRVSRAFWHVLILPYPATARQSMKIQTETLPKKIAKLFVFSAIFCQGVQSIAHLDKKWR
jgi:hypothetical protein